MKYLLPLLDRETLLNLITAAAEHYKKSNDVPTVETAAQLSDLLAMSYVFLGNFTMYTQDVPLFKSFLSLNDIEAIKNINIYNYNKLKLHSYESK